MERTFVVASWNVNSIKVRLPQVRDWLQRRPVDVLALQELKCATASFPAAEFAELGYHAAVLGQKAYNGVALLAREPLHEIETELTELRGDDQARFIAARCGPTPVINVYAPNGQEVGADKYRYKLAWLDALAQRLAKHRRPEQPLLLVGDFNIAPDERDIYDPQAFADRVLFSEPERRALARLLDWGLVDVFRCFESQARCYSWWDYRMNAFRRNLGARIDLILATAPLARAALSCVIDVAARRAAQPSDHAPVVATFRWDG